MSDRTSAVENPGDDDHDESDTNGSVEASTASQASREAARNRKVQYRFGPETDELLAKKVRAYNPYRADFGAVGPTWERVAHAINVNVDGRRCRERIKLLVKNRKLRVRAYETSGRIEEQVSPIDQLLDEIIVLQESGGTATANSTQERVELEEEKEDPGTGSDETVLRVNAAESGKPPEKRKRVDDSALLAFFQTRLEAETEIKRLKLDLESRRLRLEEKRHEMAERKAEIESQERVAMINLLAGMSTRLFGNATTTE